MEQTSRKLLTLLAVAALVGGGYFLVNYRLELVPSEDGSRYIKITPRSEAASDTSLPPPGRGRTLAAPIRIATWNLAGLDARRWSGQQVNDVLHILSRFELIALQGVRADQEGLLLKLIDQLNAAGARYDIAADRSRQPDASLLCGALLFDRDAIEIDLALAEAVADPTGSFLHRPLVATFRVRGPKPDEAFTFKLINVHTDADRAEEELDLLDDVYRAVRDDGQEDDILVVGDFATDCENLGPLGQMLDMTCLIRRTPTTLRGTLPVDNILLHRRATTEYTGRSGVLDIMREFGLSAVAAREITEHLPVWAEFSPYEGGSVVLRDGEEGVAEL